jgi:hypothetical protein
MIDKYRAIQREQLLIEGPEFYEDLSYSLIDQNIHMKNLEKGIPIDAYLLLNNTPCKAEDGSQDENLTAFLTALNNRNSILEHAILNRISCHKSKYDQLYRSNNK